MSILMTGRKASKIRKICKRIKTTDIIFHKNQNYLALSSKKLWLYSFWLQGFGGKDCFWDKLLFVFLPGKGNSLILDLQICVL